MKKLVEGFEDFTENDDLSFGDPTLNMNYSQSGMKLSEQEIELIHAEISDAIFRWDRFSGRQRVYSKLPTRDIERIVLRTTEEFKIKWMQDDKDNEHLHKYRNTAHYLGLNKNLKPTI